MEKLKKILYPVFFIQMFADPNPNVTTDDDLSVEMKTFYSDYLIDMATPKLVHDQFGQKHPIPKNGGKTIEFRKYSPLGKMLKPLQEGVTPDGQSLSVTNITATVAQYGGYVTLSDMLILTAIDNNIVEATKLLGDQSGSTLDTITREVLAGGTNVMYYDGSVASRQALTSSNKMTVDVVRRAARFLKAMNARPFDDGNYVAIIHPDVSYDLMSDSAWQAPHEYVDTENIYAGEIGRIAGVRFVETTEAKIFHAEDLTSLGATLKVASYSSKVITLATDADNQITADDAAALAGRTIIVGSGAYTIVSATAYVAAVGSGSATAATITIKETPTSNPSANDVIYPGEGGSAGRDVYSTLFLADNAYGITEVTGGGLQHFTKQLGSAGTADPLNQRATVGWKATKVAERLVDEYMIRVETCSTFESGAN